MCSNASFIELVYQNVLPGWLHVTRQDTRNLFQWAGETSLLSF